MSRELTDEEWVKQYDEGIRQAAAQYDDLLEQEQQRAQNLKQLTNSYTDALLKGGEEAAKQAIHEHLESVKPNQSKLPPPPDNN